MDLSKLSSAPPRESDEECLRLPMVHNPLPPPYQETPHLEPPPPGHPAQPQEFGNPAQYAAAAYDQPGFATIPSSVYMGQAQRNRLKDYLGCSVFTMFCCCLPLGMAAVIQSIIAREANFYGDRMRAERKSRNAKILNQVALGIGTLILLSLIGGLVYFLLLLFRFLH